MTMRLALAGIFAVALTQAAGAEPAAEFVTASTAPLANPHDLKL